MNNETQRLRLLAHRERIEEAKFRALRRAVERGWADVSAGRYIDVEDDRLEDVVRQLGNRAARQAMKR
jgi:antitoxin ParD1/3/4